MPEACLEYGGRLAVAPIQSHNIDLRSIFRAPPV